MNKISNILKYIILLEGVLLCCTFTAFAEKEPRAFLLGGRGTNFSDRQKDRNGLLTGTYSQVHYLFGAYINGAYSGFTSNMPIAKLDKGYGIGAGLCCEYQRYYFKMQLGFGIRYQSVYTPVLDTSFIDSEVHDARDYPYHLHYHFFQRQDHSTNLYAQVPVLFGAGYNNWYFLAGCKFNLTMNYGYTSVHAIGTTAGTYDQFLGYFYEMDNHGLRKEVPMEYQDERLQFKTDVLASFETGYEWGNDIHRGSRYNPRKNRFHTEYRLRVAVFADVGIINIMPKTDLPLYDIPPSYKWDFPEYHAYHVFSSQEAMESKLHNFYVGVKLTALIGFYLDRRCKLCGDYTTEAWMASPEIRPKRKRSNGLGK